MNNLGVFIHFVDMFLAAVLQVPGRLAIVFPFPLNEHDHNLVLRLARCCVGVGVCTERGA